MRADPGRGGRPIGHGGRPDGRPSGRRANRDAGPGQAGGAEVETAATLAALEAIHRRKTGALLASALAHGGGDRGSPRDVHRGARPLRQGRGTGVPDRRRPARRSGRRDQAGQARRQGFRAGQMDVPQVSGRRRQPPPRPAVGRRGRGGARAARPARRPHCRDLALALLERDR